MTLGALAKVLGGELNGPADLELARPGGYDEGRADEIVVAFDEAAARTAEQTDAGAVILPRGVATAKPSITVDDPRQALMRLAIAFAPGTPAAQGVHPSAVVDPSASLGEAITVGPGAVIGANVVIGDDCRIGANVVIGDDCQVGDGVVLHPQVTLYHGTELGHRVVIYSGTVVGADGFGFIPLDGAHRRIPHFGRVVVEDDVEIGANTCIDRAKVGATRIGRGTKIDNLVMIAHNCRIGDHCLIVGQAGMAGSCELGDHVVLAGQVGVRDHIKIGAGVQVAAKSGIMNNIADGQAVAGAPAQPHKQWLRQLAMLRRLATFEKRLRTIERDLADKGEDAGLAP